MSRLDAVTRRDFLSYAGCAAIAAAARNAEAARLSFLPSLAPTTNAVSDYKALVCVFLNGGNDGNNTVVPLTGTGWTNYFNARSAAGLAIAQGSFLSVTPPSLGAAFGLHPSLARLRTLYNAGRAAVVCNVGTLVEPIPSRTEYRNGTRKRPYQLFSHSDQVNQWQNGRADIRSQIGWGGTMADLQPASAYPVITSISGLSLFTLGQTTRPLAINDANTNLSGLLQLSGFSGTPTTAEQQRRAAFNNLRTIDLDKELVASASQTVDQAMAISASFATANVALKVNKTQAGTLPVDPTWVNRPLQNGQQHTLEGFPDTGIGRQLCQVAKIIKLNLNSVALNLGRQLFYVSAGGYDTHSDQLTGQATLLTQLSDALYAFESWLANDNEMAPYTTGNLLADRVVAFTTSDFGRTLLPTGTGTSVGSDHGWGGHAFVVGGPASLKGGNFYGFAGPSGSLFPTLVTGNASDLDTDSRGRWIPTVSVEQYGATFGQWFGLSPAQLATVFPLLSRFPNGLLPLFF